MPPPFFFFFFVSACIYYVIFRTNLSCVTVAKYYNDHQYLMINIGHLYMSADLSLTLQYTVMHIHASIVAPVLMFECELFNFVTVRFGTVSITFRIILFSSFIKTVI